jgi:hypothetical protein
MSIKSMSISASSSCAARVCGTGEAQQWAGEWVGREEGRRVADEVNQAAHVNVDIVDVNLRIKQLCRASLQNGWRAGVGG